MSERWHADRIAGAATRQWRRGRPGVLGRDVVAGAAEQRYHFNMEIRDYESGDRLALAR